jgi:hypothetical protein
MRFNFSPGKQKYLIDGIKQIGELSYPIASDIPLSDESDRIFYDTVKANGAILITGNTKHYPTEKFIMTPAEFLNLIENRCV